MNAVVLRRSFTEMPGAVMESREELRGSALQPSPDLEACSGSQRVGEPVAPLRFCRARTGEAEAVATATRGG
jgi:hypothetical protein